jgi:putative membrane protein
VFTSLALAAAVAHPFGHGFGWLFFLIPLFWILVFVLIFGVIGRRWRRNAWGGGYGPGGYGHWGHQGPWAQAAAARSAESSLAERFAQGDIDEKEYRARLEVLRASAPQPPVPPQK